MNYPSRQSDPFLCLFVHLLRFAFLSSSFTWFVSHPRSLCFETNETILLGMGYSFLSGCEGPIHGTQKFRELAQWWMVLSEQTTTATNAIFWSHINAPKRGTWAVESPTWHFLWLLLSLFLQQALLLLKWFMHKVVGEMKIMYRLSNRSFCSPEFIWLQSLLSAQPPKAKINQPWALDMVPFPGGTRQPPGGILITLDHLCHGLSLEQTFTLGLDLPLPPTMLSGKNTICGLTECCIKHHSRPHCIVSKELIL